MARLSTVQYVAKWMKIMEQEVKTAPGFPEGKVSLLRLHLLQEELGELALALSAEDPVAALDALTDLQVVLDGTYVALGLQDVKEEAFDEVMRSNFSKFDDEGKPVRDPVTGRIRTGPNYSAPDLRTVLAFHPASLRSAAE
jgi:NTP pyrophosphatase (non-canonical NTP hydrolase)